MSEQNDDKPTFATGGYTGRGASTPIRFDDGCYMPVGIVHRGFSFTPKTGEWPFVSPRRRPCRVYWGSHGCGLEYGHDGHHDCQCCECEDHERDHAREGCVSTHPYYGPDTVFWGEDAADHNI